jgi:hypothetical protein
MNERSDMDRVLSRWFEDGPSTMPDRVVDVVADRIARQRQRPAWRLLWRPYKMNTIIKVGAALAAVLVVAVIGWNLRPGGSPGIGGPVSPSPSPSVTPSIAPAATASPPWDSISTRSPCGLLGCGGPLTAGTYASKAFQPAVSYTLTDRWVNLRDWPEFFQLYPDTLANRQLAAADEYPPYILILPGPTKVSPSAPCPGEGTASDLAEVDAAGFTEFLASRQHLSVAEPVSVTLSGLAGRQVDVGFKPGWTGCLPGTPIGMTHAQTDGFRFIVLDTPDGKSLLISVWSPTDFDTFVAAAMPVVQSFQFATGPSPS